MSDTICNEESASVINKSTRHLWPAKTVFFQWNPTLWLLSVLWPCIVLLSLIEPKQIESVFSSMRWFYPADLLFGGVTLFYWLSRTRIPHFPRQLTRVYLAFAVFAVAYLLAGAVNLCLESWADTSLMINGVGRTILQYLIVPPLILCTLSCIFRDRHRDALQSFILPSLMAIAVFFGVILLVVFAGGVGIPTEIIDEIMRQSWVPVGSLILFIPKWGCTYAESQEFGLFLLLSFFLVDIYREDGTHTHDKKYYLLSGLYLVLILWTASKGVLVGGCIYLLLRNRRYVQIKSTVLIALFALIVFFLGYGIVRDPVTFVNKAQSYSSVEERVFHAFYFLKSAAEHPLHLLIGLGARQYGTLVSQDYPLAFNRLTAPVSMFALVTDSGFLGLACYFIMMASIWLTLRGYRAKLAVVAALIADIWMPDWSTDVYVLFLLIVLFVARKEQNERA